MGPALLATFLIATLCPFIPVSPAGAAPDENIIVLPAQFTPYAVNNEGVVAGTEYSTGPSYPAVFKDGVLTPLAGGPIQGMVGFNDQGEALVRTANGLEVRSESTTRILPPFIMGETERKAYTGWGPSDSGEVIGNIGWNSTTRSNAVRYQGASPPTVITQLSTVLAFNDDGVIFGQLDANPAAFAMLDGGTVTPVSGLTGGNYIFPRDFSDAGHLLYSGATGYNLWKDGKNTPLSGGLPQAVNDEGVVISNPTMYPGGFVTLRYDNGQTRNLDDLIGELPVQFSGIRRATDINNDCSILAEAQVKDQPFQIGHVLIHLEDCKAEPFVGGFFRPDNSPPTIPKGEEVDVRLRVANNSGEQLTNVTLISTEAKETQLGGAATILQASETLPTTLAASGLESQGFVDLTIRGDEAGKVMLTAELSAVRDGEPVTGTLETLFSISAEDLVVNLTLDPPEYEVPEDGEFEPVEITATVSFTNATDQEMSELRLQDLDVARVFSGQELYVTYTSGIRPDPLDPDVIVPTLPAGATSPEFQAIFTATEDGEVEFSAMATAKLGESGGATGVKKVRWKAKVKKYVEITTEVINPADGGLLDAGLPVTINGTVENLTNSHKVVLGPLFPTLVGNTGTMTLAYDEPAPNPTFPVPVDPLELAPGEKKTFQVRFTTNASDPRMYEAQPSGGTRAYATFEPWGQAIEVKDPNDGEPEIVDIRTYDTARPGNGAAPGEDPDAQVKATPEALFQRISIDDSVEIPVKDLQAIAAGIMLGGAEGLTNAAIAAIYSIPDLIKMPYTVLVAAYDYQAKVWDSFTEEEKDQFLTETSFMVVSILMRNVEFGLRDSQELYDEVYQMAGEHLTKTQNDWETGDYLATTRGYSAFMSETIGSVAGPVILSKMAQSPKAVAALNKYQAAINARMAATFAWARNVRYVDNVLPILQSIENGAEPTLTAIAKLWGVTPEEIAEYKRICGIIGCLAHIRSRHVSSVEWIKKFGALLKPENLKIKTVNELDVMLGYDIEDLGSVVFRKPEILKTLGSGATESQISAEARRFAASKGFNPDTKEFLEAVKRLEDKVDEWNKYEKTYKQWDKRGWIDTSFNYEGNAIPEYRFDADGNVIGKLTGADKGSFRGFRLREKNPGSGDEEFIVEMLDGKTGKWRRTTGDIDPVDFTYTDGSPLSPEDHARLIHLLQNSPIGAEHGYTSTFLGFKDPVTGAIKVKPGPELVKKQFKPNEPALQIAPDGAPRATRIDVENSRWNGPYDYNMRWVNGFVDAGSKRARGLPQAVDANFDVVPLDAPAQIALPVRAKPSDPTVGRFIIKHGNTGESAALVMGENGLLQTVLADGTTQDSPLHTEAFTEGPMRTITVAPASTLAPNEPTGPEPAPVRIDGASGFGGFGGFGGTAFAAATTDPLGVPKLRTAMASLTAGSTTIRVATSEGLAGQVGGFERGQQVAIGVGTDHIELRTLVAAVSGQLTLDQPLATDHQPGEIVMMVVSAAGVPIDPSKGLDPLPADPTTPGTPTPGTTPTTPGGPSTGTDGTPGAGSVHASTTGAGGAGVLGMTGVETVGMLLAGMLLLVAGLALHRRGPAHSRASEAGHRDVRKRASR